jgi:hypothetical protein
MTTVAPPPSGIAAALAGHGARFLGEGTPLDRAIGRAAATTAVAAAFPVFERVRDVAIGRLNDPLADPAACEMVAVLAAAALLGRGSAGLFAPSADADRWLRGGWLEEHVGLSALAAGADEVRIGQKIVWEAGGFHGENEIDTIARFAERLVFVSAKAFRSRLEGGDARHRERLMEALHEADDLIDHFGDAGSVVALVVSTDLWDERRHRPRYEQLYGKAAALGVALVTLEGLARTSLVGRLRELGAGPRG